MFGYVIYLEGLEYPEMQCIFFYQMHSGTPKYRNMLGNSLPVSPAQHTTEIA